MTNCNHNYKIIKTQNVKIGQYSFIRKINTSILVCENCKDRILVKKEFGVDGIEVPKLILLDNKN